MKIAICNETFQNWPFEKAFQYARSLGYTGIEIAPFTMQHNVNDISQAERQSVRELADKHDLEIIGLHWLLAYTQGCYLTSPEQATQRKTTEYLRQLSQLCADLGGTIMVLGSPQQRNLLPGVTQAQAMQIAAEVIGGAAATFADHGVCLALEPLGPQEGDFLLTAEKGIELAKMIDHPNVRLHLDVKAMSSETKPIPSIIRDSRQYLAHFHANDANRRGPGMGKIDFVPIIQALREVGYDDWISVEVFDYEPGVETLASESIRYLRQVSDQVEPSR